jgi:hypothetical protein
MPSKTLQATPARTPAHARLTGDSLSQFKNDVIALTAGQKSERPRLVLEAILEVADGYAAVNISRTELARRIGCRNAEAIEPAIKRLLRLGIIIRLRDPRVRAKWHTVLAYHPEAPHFIKELSKCPDVVASNPQVRDWENAGEETWEEFESRRRDREQEDWEDKCYRDQMLDGMSCPTCIATALCLAFYDEAERCIIENLVRVDKAPLPAVSWLEFGGRYRVAFDRLYEDNVIFVIPDGSLAIHTPGAWKPSRLRNGYEEWLAMVDTMSHGKCLQPCAPSIDHPVVPREQVESPQAAAHDDDEGEGPIILKFDPSLQRKSKRLPTQETVRALCARRPARTS